MTVQRPNRDEYKRIVNVVKTVLGVKYPTRNLGSIESCEDALMDIVTKGCDLGTPLNYYRKKCETYENEIRVQNENINKLTLKNQELSRELYQLKNKKWWKFWG